MKFSDCVSGDLTDVYLPGVGDRDPIMVADRGLTYLDALVASTDLRRQEYPVLDYQFTPKRGRPVKATCPVL